MRPNTEVYARVAELLRERAKPGQAVALMDIGQVGYQSGLPLIDISGLVTPWVAHSPGGFLDKRYPVAQLLEADPEFFVLRPRYFPDRCQDRAGPALPDALPRAATAGALRARPAGLRADRLRETPVTARSSLAIERAVALLAAIAALWQVATLLFVFGSRIAYPMDLEWMEGGSLYHAHRLMLGQGIYVDPSEGFLPYPYPPLHFAVLALVGAFVGLDYWSGRAASIGLVMGAAWLLARCAARRAGGTRLDAAVFALIALGAVAAGFPGTGGWYDLARKDALAAALPIFAAVTAASGSLTRGRIVAVALLLTSAVYAKQTGLLFLPVVGVYVLSRDRRLGLELIGATALAGGAVLLGLQLATDGWFLHWVLLMGEHPISVERLVPNARALFELAPCLPAVAVLVLWLTHRGALSREALLWVGMLGAALAAALLPHLKPYVFINHSLPVALLSGPVTLIVLGAAISHSAVGSPLARWGRSLVYAAAVALLWGGRWDAGAYVPDDEEWSRARSFERFLSELPGDVFLPNHPWQAVRTGIVRAADPHADVPGHAARGRAGQGPRRDARGVAGPLGPARRARGRRCRARAPAFRSRAATARLPAAADPGGFRFEAALAAGAQA